jgi:hypothetical protein
MGSRRELAAAVVASLLLVAANAAFVSSEVGFVHRPKRCLETDHYRYIDMASAPPGRAETPRAREAPFCYRILTPALVYGLGRVGLPTDAAFYVLTNVFLFGYLLAFHRLLRAGGAGQADALLGIVLVALVPGGVRWYEYQYWMPDPACLLLTTLAVLWIRRGRERPLLVVSPLAILGRETYLLVLPYAFAHAWSRASFRVALVRTLRLALVIVPIVLLVHALIVPMGGSGLVAAAHEMIAFRLRHLWENQVYFATVGSFGVLLPLALLRPTRLVAFARRQPEDLVLVALAYASLAFANNTDRLLVYALPAVVPVGLRNLEALRASTGFGSAPWALAVLVLQGFFYVATPFHEMGISIYQPTNVPVAAAMAALWLLGLALIRRRAWTAPT